MGEQATSVVPGVYTSAAGLQRGPRYGTLLVGTAHSHTVNFGVMVLFPLFRVEHASLLPEFVTFWPLCSKAANDFNVCQSLLENALIVHVLLLAQSFTSLSEQHHSRLLLPSSNLAGFEYRVSVVYLRSSSARSFMSSMCLMPRGAAA